MNNNEDKEMYFLMANPLKLNKDKLKKESYVDKYLLNLIKKKYSQYDIEDSDYNKILNNLEDLFIDLNRKNIINKFVNNVIEDVINTI
jgi:hypothetical protein